MSVVVLAAEGFLQQYVILSVYVITCAVLAEDAIKAALNNYKVKKENKAAAAAAASAN